MKVSYRESRASQPGVIPLREKYEEFVSYGYGAIRDGQGSVVRVLPSYREELEKRGLSRLK